jgi:hypothetical protein
MHNQRANRERGGPRFSLRQLLLTSTVCSLLLGLFTGDFMAWLWMFGLIICPFTLATHLAMSYRRIMNHEN